jgi:acetone carboxylase gamma subunit
MRYSNSLNIKTEQGIKTLCCSRCNTTVSPANEPWKKSAVLLERPMLELAGPYTVGEKVLLRSFACPHCGVLLDTELAQEGDDFLDDRLF